MLYLLLFLLFTATTTNFTMEFAFPYDSPSSADYSSLSTSYDNGFDAYMYDFPMYDISYTTKKESNELDKLTKATQKHLTQDCIGAINQQILESTNTHIWAARAVLANESTTIVSPENDFHYTIDGHIHYDLLPDHHIVSAWCPSKNLKKHTDCCAFSIKEYNQDDNNYHSIDPFYIPINKKSCDEVLGININPTNPHQCAVRFGSHCIRIFDIEAQKEINTFTSETLSPYFGYYREFTIESLYKGLKKPVFRNNTVYYANLAHAYSYDTRSHTSSKIYTNDYNQGILALSENNGTLYIAQDYTTGGNRTVYTLDQTNQQLNTLWEHNWRRARPGDINFTYDDIHTNLLCSDEYTIMLGVRTIFIIDNNTKKIQSFYLSDKSLSSLSSYPVMALDNTNKLVHYKPEKGTIRSATIKRLSKDTMGSHITNIKTAATLQALHSEVKAEGGPVCNKGFKKFTLNKEDVSPELWAIIQAQGIKPYNYISKEKKQVLTNNPDQNGWCTLQ